MIKFFNLKTTYFLVFVSLIFWAFFAYFTMDELISSQDKYAKLINISGKQRMLSQKTALMVKRVYETNDSKLEQHGQNLRTMMIEDHQFLLKNLTSQEMVNIYFAQPYHIDEKVNIYFDLLEKFYKDKNQELVKEIEEYSFVLLPQLNDAVNAFEEEATKRIEELRERESYILFGTLITIILEALLIVVPSIKLVGQKEMELEELNNSLENEIHKETQIVRKQEQVIAKQTKLSAMAEMIEQISHQWRQPLSIISTSATALDLKSELGNIKTTDIQYSARKINENAQYLSQTLESFKGYLFDKPVLVNFSVKENLEHFLTLIDASIKEHKIDVSLTIKNDAKINGYPNELIECFIHIFNNAKDAFIERNIAYKNRFLFITLEIKNQNIVVSFRDNAGGIPKEILPRVLEPYFTTKHESIGVGLSLNTTYMRVVNVMNGNFDVRNVEFKHKYKAYKGVDVVFTLPVVS